MEPFDSLLRTHGPHVWRVCRALTGPDDADDAWQETFLAALAAYPRANPTNPRAWLISIAHHKCADIHRRRARTGLPLADLDPPAPTADDGDLWRIVATLAPKQRRVVAYRYLGGLPYAEIAEILGGSAAAARRAGADGIRRLREILEDQ